MYIDIPTDCHFAEPCYVTYTPQQQLLWVYLMLIHLLFIYISLHSKWASVRVVVIPGLPVKQYGGHPKGTSEALVFRDGSHPEDTTVYYSCPP